MRRMERKFGDGSGGAACRTESHLSGDRMLLDGLLPDS